MSKKTNTFTFISAKEAHTLYKKSEPAYYEFITKASSVIKQRAEAGYNYADIDQPIYVHYKRFTEMLRQQGYRIGIETNGKICVIWDRIDKEPY